MTIPGRLASRLRAMSARERVLVVLCVVFVAGMAVYRLLVSPAIGDYRRKREAIPRQRATLARYEAAAKGRETVEEMVADAVERMETWEEGLLTGDNPAAAGAALQDILKPIVARPDTRLTSVRSLTAVPKGSYAEVAVQMDLQTTTAGLAELLAAIPLQRKHLQVKKLSVTSAFYGAIYVNRPELLMVSVQVAGLARAPSGGLPEKGAEP